MSVDDGIVVEHRKVPIQFKGAYCWKCPQLLSSRFGTEYQCRIFSEQFGSGSDSLDLEPDSCLILRHEKCFGEDCS